MTAYLLVSMVWCGVAQELRFNANGRFKIVQFTYLHWKSNVPANHVSRACLENILDAEKPVK